ncbi:hypothetical protein LX36DRAFT_753186 [Colletotrichum falcatum]|nr:hypothetical protein LX36DRAFT_753186 [Colletotrichum falcatum]
MKGIVSLVLGLAAFRSLAAAASIPGYFQRSLTTRSQLDTNQIRAELGKLLSKETAIFGPGDDRYDAATSRWNNFAVPQVKVVISPGRESDVSTMYCNDNSIDFLTINRHHGNSQSLGSFNGVQINMASLQGIKIQPGGRSAWFQGRTYDGRAVRVNKMSHGDLLWAMKGAGHNFGIVTSFKLNIFPCGPDTWHYQNFIWRGDKLEAVFGALRGRRRNNIYSSIE